MARNRSTISKAKSYQEMGEFWDSHELTEFSDQIHEVEFAVDIQGETAYFPVEKSLSSKLRFIAHQQGVSPETLLNLWLQEKVREGAPSK